MGLALCKRLGRCLVAVGSAYLFACATTPAAPTAAPAPGYTEKTALRLQGWRRVYLTHIPTGYDHRHAYPLVVVLHGAFVTARQMEQHSAFSALADREGFLVLYPNGIGFLGWLQHWNAGHCCGRALRDEIDDVGFVATAIADVAQRFHVDRQRVYIVGHSNGGMLAYRFTAERAKMVAAMAAISATIGSQATEGQPSWRLPWPVVPVPVIVFHGADDKVIVYQGGQSRRGRNKRVWTSVDNSVGFWVQRNGCEEPPGTGSLNAARVLHKVWHCARNQAEVELYRLEQWGHVWPGPYFTGKLASDDALKDFDAAEIIWQFFQRYQRQP